MRSSRVLCAGRTGKMPPSSCQVKPLPRTVQELGRRAEGLHQDCGASSATIEAFASNWLPTMPFEPLGDRDLSRIQMYLAAVARIRTDCPRLTQENAPHIVQSVNVGSVPGDIGTEFGVACHEITRSPPVSTNDEPLTFACPHARCAGTIDVARRSLHVRTHDVQRSVYQLAGYVILTYT